MDGDVKAGVLDLVAYAVDEGWSLRRVCGVLEVTHPRVIFWLDRINSGAGLEDRIPGPTQAPHALLDWERDEIIAIYDTWHEIDRSYRKLAHRGSRQDRVHASESSFWRVLEMSTSFGPTVPSLIWPHPDVIADAAVTLLSCFTVR
ncbi:MAG: hypothetical protein GEU78_19005 [Actinobacteria bacterium]|nr:hypothetical protein [Actinomycetota bacterium]